MSDESRRLSWPVRVAAIAVIATVTAAAVGLLLDERIGWSTWWILPIAVAALAIAGGLRRRDSLLAGRPRARWFAGGGVVAIVGLLLAVAIYRPLWTDMPWVVGLLGLAALLMLILGWAAA